MAPGDETAADRSADPLQLNRPLIQQAAGLILMLRLVADGTAAFLLSTSYPAGAVPPGAMAVNLLFGVHGAFSGICWWQYRRGTFSSTLVLGDAILSGVVMLAAAHYAEGIYSPVLYLLLVQIASFVVIFGPRAGRMAASAAAAGVLLQAVGDAFGLWPAATARVASPFVPRLFDFGTMLGASAIFLIGLTRMLRWVRAKEDALRGETERARAAARFQAKLAELARTALTQEGLEPALAVTCEQGRALLDCDGVRVCLVDGDRLVTRAVAPAGAAEIQAPAALDDDPSAAAAAVRLRRPVVTPAAADAVSPGERVLAVPLIGQSGRVLGALSCVDDGRPRDVEGWQVGAGLLAAQATAAVERGDLVERLQAEARRVGALLRASQEIGAAGSYRELEARVTALTCELLAADAAVLVPQAQADAAGADLDEGAIRAPLRHAGRAYGILAARRTTLAGRFDASQVALLEGLARHTSLALANLRLLEEERSAATLATTLLEVAREFNLALDVSTLLSRLAARSVDLGGAAAAAIALWRPKERAYRVEALHGGPVSDATVVGMDFAAGVYRRDGDCVRLDPAWVARFAEAGGVDPAGASEVSLPLERGGETAGVLTLVWRAGEAPTSRQLALARGLVNQAAVALQNVRLLDDIREASRLKSEFVATMSHELRTPLNVILGYTNLFLEDAFGDLTEEQRSVLGRMHRSASELFDLVTATLDLNRLEAGKSRVNVEPVAVPDLFAQLEAETVSPERRPVELRWQLASDLPALETDRAKLRIVLKNLIGNAIKFTERGNVTVAAEPADDAVVFTVADTGVGIRQEDLPVIFEMFRQIESANTRKHGGVGLGLYIVKRLLAELRGEIDVQSEVGAGSRFRIKLPLSLRARG